jgi:glycosyltransferase involved in cell wall biosynthesis
MSKPGSVIEIGQEDRCELTVLMPCLNEAETIGVCVQKALGYLTSHGVDGEVLVADNGSNDGSPQIAQSLGARVVHVAEKGYGSALLGGIEAARGRYIIMGDADDSYDFDGLDPFVEKLREGYDLVMGNRFRGGIKPGAMPFLHRYLGNPVLTAIGRLFFRSPIGDFHCGLRGFARESIRRLGLSTTGMEFASEMVVKATLRELRVTEVPTTLSPDGRSSPPHLRTWRDGWRHLRFLLLFSPRWLFLYPGLLLMAGGLAGTLWLIPAPRRIGAVTLDVNTLVYAAVAINLGFQMVSFFVFAKVFAANVGLLPPDRHASRMLRVVFGIEEGIVAGLILLMGGLAASIYAVGFWGQASFGTLDPTVSLRIVIPSASAMVLGLQLVASSFFLGVLQLDRR